MDVLLDESYIFRDLPVTAYAPSADDILAITGRTGGATETVLFDNLAVDAPALPPVFSDPRGDVAQSVSLDAVELGQTGEGNISVSNLGAIQDLIISSATLGGTNAGSFEILTDLPLTVAPGATGNIAVRVAAGEVVGPLQATVDLVTNDQVERRRNVSIGLSVNVIPASIGRSVYTQNFNSFGDGETELADGSLLFSNNAVALTDGGRLQLTKSGTNSSQAWWKLPALGTQSTEGWVAIFDLALEASGTPADGFSFNFGPIPDEGNPAGAFEEGWGQGLAIEFDTWNNDGEGADNGIGVDVSVDGFSEDEWLNRVEGGADPRENDIYSFDGISRLVVIRYEQTGEDTGILNVDYGGNALFTDLAISGFTPEADHRFAFAARTGGASETILLDNVTIMAPPVDAGVYSQNFTGFEDSATDLGDGSFVAGTPDGATSVQGGALLLTEDMQTSASGYYLLPSLGEAQAEGYTASFTYSLFESAGGNPPADGFSFNVGDFAEELPGGGVEEGLGGLAIEFDTWDNNNAAEEGEFGIGIDVSIGGETLEGGRRRIDPGADKNNNELFRFDGSPNSISVTWERVDGEGQVSVVLNGEPLFANLPTGDYSPSATDRMAFAARTGGATETVLIDDVYAIAPSILVRAGRDPKIVSVGSLGLSAEAAASSTASLTVSNEGFSEDLVISELGVEGDGAANFEVITAAPLTIAPGESAEIEVRYTANDGIGLAQPANLFLISNDSSPQARRRLISLIGVTALPGGAYAQNFDAFADGTTDLEDFSVTTNNNDSLRVVGGKLQLTESGITGSAATYKLPPLGLGGTQAFIATFDYSLFHEGGNPADGFSFVFGDIQDDAGGSEEGFGSGLAIEFDTWDNENNREDEASDIGVDVSVDGETLEGGRMRIAEGDDPLDNDFFVFDGSTRQVEVLWFRTGTEDGLVTVSVDGEALYEDLPTPGFDPGAQYRFAFAARTGDATETLQLDNVNIVTGNEDPNLFVPASVDLGLVQPGQGTQTFMVPVRNTGQENTLMISSVTLASTNPGVFTLQGDVPTAVAPFSAGVVSVVFDPTNASGRETGQITIASDDPSQPTTVISLSASVPLSADLVAWYPMDDTNGELSDASGNGLDGSFNGVVDFGQAALASGSSVRLVSTADAAAFASVPNFPVLHTFSISMWVQVLGDAPDSGHTLFAKSHPEFEAAHSLALFPTIDNSLGYVVSENENGFTAFSPNQNLDTASHVVLVHEDANGNEDGADSTRLYVNGVEVNVADAPAGFMDEIDTLQLGARAGSNGLFGFMDDVQVYRRAITAEEVTELFNNPGMPLDVDGGGNPGGDADSDKDGVSDANEALAGTDPNDAFDYFRATESTRSSDGFTFSFASQAGRAYRVEYAEELAATGWVEVGTVTGEAGMTSFTDTDAERLGRSGGFYRVVTP